MAGTITKTVRGHRYTYFEYFEDGKTVQKYCGPEGSRKAKIKALELEYGLLEKRRTAIVERMASVKDEMEILDGDTEGMVR